MQVRKVHVRNDSYIGKESASKEVANKEIASKDRFMCRAAGA